jgi:hypothetical protein
MMADIGDVAVALFGDGRLVSAAALEIVVADEAHIVRFSRFRAVFARRRSPSRFTPGERNDTRNRKSGCTDPPRSIPYVQTHNTSLVGRLPLWALQPDC